MAGIRKCYYLDFADVNSELVFIPLENSEDQARLLSMQLTGAWLSEAIEMNFDVLAPVSGRIGRYPSRTIAESRVGTASLPIPTCQSK